MARLRRPKSDNDEGDSAWLETYADMVTLLMAFFVLLYSISDVDKAKFSEISAGIVEALSGRTEEGAPMTEKKFTLKQMDMVQEAIKQTLTADLLENAAHMEVEGASIKLEFQSNALYSSGSAKIRPGFRWKLRRVAQEIARLQPGKYFMVVEGHTDDVQVRSGRFGSNWELAALRATRVVEFMGRNGIPHGAMQAVSFSDTRPKRPNRDPSGVPDPFARAANRRIVLHIQHY